MVDLVILNNMYEFLCNTSKISSLIYTLFSVILLTSTLEPNDYLLVYDGLNVTSPLLGKMEGYSVPSDVWSSSNSLMLKFHSDERDVALKYDASYKGTYLFDN